MKELIANLILILIPSILYILVCWVIPIMQGRPFRDFDWKEFWKTFGIIHFWVFVVLSIIGLFVWAFYVRMGVL